MKSPHNHDMKWSMTAGLLVLLVIAGLWWQSRDRGITIVKVTPPQTACSLALDIDNAAILLTNTGTERWIVAEIYLDGEYPKGYRTEIRAPREGETAHIPLGNFIAHDGRPYPLYRRPHVAAVGGDAYGWRVFELVNKPAALNP
jgi:hypothetical protein